MRLGVIKLFPFAAVRILHIVEACTVLIELVAIEHGGLGNYVSLASVRQVCLIAKVDDFVPETILEHFTTRLLDVVALDFLDKVTSEFSDCLGKRVNSFLPFLRDSFPMDEAVNSWAKNDLVRRLLVIVEYEIRSRLHVNSVPADITLTPVANAHLLLQVILRIVKQVL